MKATGLFFLRTRPYTARNTAGEPVLVLPVVEHEDRDGRRVTLNELLGAWTGADAMAWWNLHLAELKPGRGLDLELDRMRWDGREWRAHVTRCSLAPLPPSWVKASAQADPTPPAAAPGTGMDQPPQPMAA